MRKSRTSWRELLTLTELWYQCRQLAKRLTSPESKTQLSAISPSDRANELYSMKTRELWKSMSSMRIGVYPDDQDSLPREAADCFSQNTLRSEEAVDRIGCAIQDGSTNWAIFDANGLAPILRDPNITLSDFIFQRLVHLGLHFALNAPRGHTVPAPWVHSDFDEVARGLLYLFRSNPPGKRFDGISGILNPELECLNLQRESSQSFKRLVAENSVSAQGFLSAYTDRDRTGDCASWSSSCQAACLTVSQNASFCHHWCYEPYVMANSTD